MPAPVPASGPAPDPGIPKIIEHLIAAAPSKLQEPLREALKKASIINPNDPVFELVLVLELIGVYYQRIAATVVKAGTDIDTKNATALASLDDRVRKLQGLAQLIQRATDKLEVIDQDIVKLFPVGWVVEQVVKKMDARINALPLTTFDEKTAKAHVAIDNMNRSVKASADALTSASTEIENAAEKIQAAKLPRVSLGWAVLWLAIGAAITGLAFSFAISRSLPEAKRVLPLVHSDETGMKIVVPESTYQSATMSDTKEVTIHLNP